MAENKSTRRISGTAYSALRSALSLVYWYKDSLEKYLRAALREYPEILAGLDFKAKKREIADEVVDRLMVGEAKYQSSTVQLMIELANIEKFPELERLEDADKWVGRARDAVAELKRHTHDYETLVSAREKLDAELAANRRQTEVQRKFADDLERLKDRFMAMHSDSDANERGRAFERFLNDLFALFDLEPRLGYSLATEQIDGAFSFDTDDYIVEAKWTKKPVSREQADAFAAKVQRRGKNALGLMVSVGGFSGAALDEYSRRTPFMTMEGGDIFGVLEQRVGLDELLRRKKRHANETGECYFPLSRLFSD